MKKKIALLIFSLMAGSVANAAAPTLEAEAGYKVQLRNIAFDQSDRGGTVTGWISRAPGAFGSIDAHLHIDLIGADRKVLDRVEYGWLGRLPVRPQRSLPIRASLSEGQLRGVELISVKVAAGRMHRK